MHPQHSEELKGGDQPDEPSSGTTRSTREKDRWEFNSSFLDSLNDWWKKNDWTRECVNCHEPYSKNAPFNLCHNDFGSLSLDSAAPQGPQVGGRYDLLCPLGIRDHTVSYLALDTETTAEVIVQFIRFTSVHLTDRKTIGRFLDCASGFIGLQHPNLYTILDTGLVQSLTLELAPFRPQVPSDGPYFVGEACFGVPASDHLKARGRLDARFTISIFDDVLTGLEHAQEAGQCHDSLTLSNILLMPRDERSLTAKVMDFGIASRALGGVDWQGPSSETRTANIYGSSAGMAPEVIRGSRPTERSVIYSLGCCLYEALTGHPVFEREAELFTLYAHINDEPEPFAPSVRVSARLESLTMSCLAKDPQDRPGSIKELRERLGKCRG